VVDPADIPGSRNNLPRPSAADGTLAEEPNIQELIVGLDCGKNPVLNPSPTSKTLNKLMDLVWAKSTQKSYANQWCWFLKFCHDENRSPLPASVTTLARAIAVKTMQDAPSSVPPLLTVIKAVHEFKEMTCGIDHFVIKKLVTASNTGVLSCKKQSRKPYQIN